MDQLTKRPLCVAVALAMTMVAIDASAVSVSPDGRGQVLLYPYYTARNDGSGNAYGTLLSVVNGGGSAKAVRVRFLEGKNSREVLDFNLFLSPFDVWTGAVLPDLDTGGARIGTVDRSCTLPPFSASPTSPFVAFSNAAYSGANDDGAGTVMERTKEGYFEIIEMASYVSTSTTGKAITHVPIGTPPFNVPPCNTAPNVLNDMQAATDAKPPSGGLFGGLTLIDVSAGTDYTADAVALAKFYQSGSNYQPAGAVLPDLTQATPPVSGVYASNGYLYESTWTPGTADAVSAVLMHDSLMNEFVVDTGTKSATDWVVTLPTKRYYTRKGTGLAPKLFQRNFNGMVGGCDDADGGGNTEITLFDREERKVPVRFGSLTPPRLTYALCWAANVIPFGDVSLLGSANTWQAAFAAQAPGFNPGPFPVPLPSQNGWLNLPFPTGIPGANVAVHLLFNLDGTVVSGGGQSITSASATYYGLPAIGFAVTSFMNGTLSVGSPPVTVFSNYGGSFVHKMGTTVQTSAPLPGAPTGCLATISLYGQPFTASSTVILPSTGGSIQLSVTGCSSMSSIPLTYSWSSNDSFVSADSRPVLSFGANISGGTIFRTFTVRACFGIACADYPPTPLTLIISAP